MRAAVLLLVLAASPVLAQTRVMQPAPSADRQAVALDLAALERAAVAGEAVRLEADGWSVVLRPQRLTRRGPGRFTWSGPLDGGGRGLVTVEGGHLVARLVTPRGTFVVEPAGRRSLLGGRDHVAFRAPPDAGESADDWREAPPATGAARLAVDTLFPDELHVAMFYTGAVADSLGDALPAFMQAMVDTFDDVLVNSAVGLRARLVALHGVDYAESGTMADDLYAFTDPFDGQMDDVAGVRDAAHADFAALITETGSNSATGCGIAFLMVFPDVSFSESAYSVTKRSCGGLTFAHELGHNLGLHHDRYVTQGQGATPAAHGFTNIDSLTATRPGFRTVLAYNTRCLDAGGTCDRIPFYSDPDLLWLGQPMGAAGTEDNAEAAQLTAPIAASFRAAPGQGAFTAPIGAMLTRPDCPGGLSSCGLSPAPVPAAVYRLVPGATGRYHVAGSGLDGVLALYDQDVNANAPLEGLVAYAAPDPTAPAQRRWMLTVDLVAGQPYGLLIAGRTPSDIGTATITRYGPGPLPENVTTAADDVPVAACLSLSSPAPNPSSTARLTLAVETPQAVRVVVVDALGREVAVVWEGEVHGARDLVVSGLAPGVYAVVARSASGTVVQRVTVAGEALR